MNSRHILTALALATASILVAGCGGGSTDSGSSRDSGGSSAKDAPSRSLFVQKCGARHTLADADTNGSVGPSLDGRELDAATISAQIDNGGGSMPAGLLTGSDKAAVARYVAKASKK